MLGPYFDDIDIIDCKIIEFDLMFANIITQTIGPLAAKELNTSDSLAAFSIGVFLFGAAFSAVPSGVIFQKYGRFWGFTLGCFFQLCGSAVGAVAMVWKENTILFSGCFMVGLGQVYFNFSFECDFTGLVGTGTVLQICRR